MKRLKKYTLALTILIILYLSGMYYYEHPTPYTVFNKEPEKYDLKKISIGGQIKSVEDKFYVVTDLGNGERIIITKKNLNWKPGDVISIKGIFHKEGFVEVQFGEIIWDKKYKFLISILGFVLLVLIVYKERKKFKLDF